MKSIDDILGKEFDLRADNRFEEYRIRTLECAKAEQHRGPMEVVDNDGKYQIYQCGYCSGLDKRREPTPGARATESAVEKVRKQY